MALGKEEQRRLEAKANELRHITVDTVLHAGSGHIGGALSAMDIMTILYYDVMNIKPEEPDWEDRDRFILSKGHAGIGFTSILADKGFIDKELLKSFNHTGSSLGIHLDANKVPGVDASTGSLGHGLAIALGMTLAARHNDKDYKTYCVLGDGECNEGSVWESAMAAAHYKATDLITFIDRNQLMLDGNTEDVMQLEPLTEKWQSFGFETLVIDGHDFSQLKDAIQHGLNCQQKPTAIICNTIKGCGVDFMEKDFRWHYGAISEDMAEKCHASLDRYYQQRLNKVEGV